MNQAKQQKTVTGLLTAITAVLVIVSTAVLVKKTGFSASLKAAETRSMLFELLIVFTLLFISAWHPVKTWISHLLRLAVIAGFLWLHQALLPLLAAGVYIAYLCLLGSLVTGKMFSGKPAGPAGFIAGASAQILIVCGFSAAGIGGTGFFLGQTALCFPALCVLKFAALRKCGRSAGRTAGCREALAPIFPGCHSKSVLPKDGSRLGFCLLTALIGTSLLLQAGRIGICLDYDSLHYGFRSAYVLDNGFGIYENLGSVNDVYVYPKGFEILTLPLAGFGSGTFVSAFSWWMTVVTMSAAAAIVDRFRGRDGRTAGNGRIPAGLFAAAVISAIPGIMNMAVSAKTDAVTLAVQTVCVLCFLSRDRSDCWAALAAAFLSLTMKPTAFLFSFLLTAAGLGLCVYRLVKERRGNSVPERKEQRPENSSGNFTEPQKLFTFPAMLPAILALTAVLAVLARTVLLAGVPLTTAGGALWNVLGFELKYPFNGASIGGGTEKSFLKRLAGVFVCPAGDDMSHVYIAWGSLTVTVCLAVTLIGTVSGRRKRSAEKNALLIMLLLVTAASLILIRTLWQVDGNYFMILYVLAVVSAFAAAGRPRSLTQILAPAMLMGILFCMTTNWAGAQGLTQAKLLHKGYPETQAEQEQRLKAEGKGGIYAFLAGDARNRVLAMAEQPGCFAFPCNVQSYTDLEGSGGNVKILKTLNEFKDFLDYAGTEYIYVEQSFIDTRPRASEIVGYMLEDGSLKEELSTENAEAVLYRYTGAR